MIGALQTGLAQASFAVVDDDNAVQVAASSENVAEWSAGDEANHQRLANTVTVVANAKALAQSANAHPDITEETVHALLTKRDEKLAKLTELSDNLEGLSKLRTTVTNLLYKNNTAFDAATRNQAFHKDELNKMVAEIRKLRYENIILLEVDNSDFQPNDGVASSHGSQQEFFEDDVASVASQAMFLEEAVVRDHREVARALAPNQESKQKIIEGFTAHLKSLNNTNDWLADKLQAASTDLDQAKAEYEAAESALVEVENAAIALHKSHPESISEVVVNAIKRRQASAEARKKEEEPAKWNCQIQ
jgi:hypothetical protein